MRKSVIYRLRQSISNIESIRNIAEFSYLTFTSKYQ